MTYRRIALLGIAPNIFGVPQGFTANPNRIKLSRNLLKVFRLINIQITEFLLAKQEVGRTIAIGIQSALTKNQRTT